MDEQPKLHDALVDVAADLERLLSHAQSPSLVNAQSLVQAALVDERHRALLGIGVRLLKEFETRAGATSLADDARRLRERLAILVPNRR